MISFQNCGDGFVGGGTSATVDLEKIDSASESNDIGVEISVSGLEGQELTINFVLPEVQSTKVSILWRVEAENTRLQGPLSGSVKIPAGETSSSLVLSTIDDFKVSADDDFDLLLSTSAKDLNLPEKVAVSVFENDSYFVLEVTENADSIEIIQMALENGFTGNGHIHVKINEDVVIGSKSVDNPALIIASAGAVQIVLIENYGSIVGHSGKGNSGHGGIAIQNEHEQVVIKNYGLIAGGGGGGGAGADCPGLSGGFGARGAGSLGNGLIVKSANGSAGEAAGGTSAGAGGDGGEYGRPGNDGSDSCGNSAVAGGSPGDLVIGKTLQLESFGFEAGAPLENQNGLWSEPADVEFFSEFIASDLLP